jgi:predicted molibdopterin-dependent oxidoreductase YjgC
MQSRAVSCASSINEDSYPMQKLFRAVIGTNNIDHCAHLTRPNQSVLIFLA